MINVVRSVMILCLAGSAPVFADEDVMKKMEAMEKRIAELESRLAEYESRDKRTESKIKKVEMKMAGVEGKVSGVEERLQKVPPELEGLTDGLGIAAGATMVYQFTDNANGSGLSSSSEDAGDAAYSVDLEITKEFADYGAGLILLEAGEGAGVEDELEVFSNVNFDATGGDSNVGVVEAWYEHYIGNAALRFGKLDPTYLIDDNDYANDESAQFLGRIFRNNPVAAFPDNGAGIRLGVAATDMIDIESLVMDGDADWEDMFEDVFYAGQINITPGLFDRPGNYRFYAWGSEADHVLWADAARTKEDNYGFGISFDQEMSDDLGVFARYGWQDPDVYASGASESLEQSYSVGAQLAGSAWGRGDDVVGLAFGVVVPSEEYKNSNSALEAGDEKHLELYYSYKVNDHLTISPDLQVVWDPYGGDAANGDKTILVGGVRSQIDF